ncbi:HVO_2523 family zinc finger protein [Halorubrum persicum]|uniref:HVO_2523 family zinc finger protein n=1 Tax=Halorubrum persicum TaxID=1383844 RepID=UPI0026E58C32|nr:HVO_2523 family zinc finger protein [Halorubrum persicum]
MAGPEAEEATGAEGETTADCGGRPCPRCETPMYHRHCKYVCPAHGVVYDCSDTFY